MAEVGQKVAVHYRGTLDDGTVFADTRREGGPVEFVVGSRTMLPGFELAVARMVRGRRATCAYPARKPTGPTTGLWWFPFPGRPCPLPPAFPKESGSA